MEKSNGMLKEKGRMEGSKEVRKEGEGRKAGRR